MSIRIAPGARGLEITGLDGPFGIPKLGSSVGAGEMTDGPAPQQVVIFCKMMRLAPVPNGYFLSPISIDMFCAVLSLIVTLRVSPNRLICPGDAMAEIRMLLEA